MRDRILLAVSFGTSYQATREKTIGAIERRMADRFPETDVRRCFTSRMIRKKLLERDGLRIDGPEEALRRAAERGIAELTVQPLYLMHGTEHRRLMEILREYRAGFTRIAVGKPLLTDGRDFRILAEAVLRHLPAADEKTAVVLMGHGTPAVAGRRDNAVFRILQETLRRKGADYCFVATVEGDLPPGKILPQIREQGFCKVILAPFMIVAGDHALHDLAGEGENSWKNLFVREGFEVETVLEGIGAWEEVQDLFADHAAEAASAASAAFAASSADFIEEKGTGLQDFG